MTNNTFNKFRIIGYTGLRYAFLLPAILFSTLLLFGCGDKTKVDEEITYYGPRICETDEDCKKINENLHCASAKICVEEGMDVIETAY